jgi:hypothetical protein
MGGDGMTGKSELTSFKKMWTWLIGYPAHDRRYYAKNVAHMENVWINDCPLANDVHIPDCSGCALLWDGRNGNLCCDPEAPVFKWENTAIADPDNRSRYAARVAVLAMQLAKKLERQVERCVVRRPAG